LDIQKQADGRNRRWIWVVLCLVIGFVIAVRLRLLNLPLERDEGEFAYVGQLMLDGVAPYKLAYVIKLPGTSAVYALCMALFGQTPAAIHLGLLLANVTGIVLLFLFAKRWFDDMVGLIAAATYALMSLSWGVGGNAAHATQFIVPAALGGILLLLRQSPGSAAIFCSGVLFGFAFLLKQPGLLFGFYGGLLLLAQRPGFKKLCLYGAGVILPFAVLCFVLWCAGVFDRFWYWSFTVAESGWVSPSQGWADLLWYANWARLSGQLPLWLLAAVTLPFVFWTNMVRPVRWQFAAFCAVSILAGAVGWRFNPHYLVLTLPAVGLTIGAGMVAASRRLGRSRLLSLLPAAIFCIDCGYALYAARDYFFTGTLDQVIEKIYLTHPFREAAKVAQYIKANSPAEARIAVLGSEPEIYFLSHRRSATGHISTYLLMEQQPYSHEMQEEMIREIKAASPEFIVYVENETSWYPPAKADYTLLNSMLAYIKAGYRRVGVAVNGPVPGPPLYYWGDDARKFSPDPKSHDNLMFVYQAVRQ
jgi:4-amino-4-deoxy-L-arabinose transferase-like glycosyltransferase